MNYIPTIGLEMHCEVKTNSKIFSRAKNSYSDVPNSNVLPLDMAFPGTLPVLNKEVIRKALMMSICLGCQQPDEIIFERKNYFYPDLPTGYQLTQQNGKPIGINGKLMVEVNGEEKIIYINNIHQEVDTASLDHYFDYSLIDYNRSGVPLLECVTEPCIHSAEEAVAFLETMRNIYKYTDISEADTKKGQIRCDVNISLAKEDSKELGTRVEIKNINSFSAVYDAIIYEIKRQTQLLESGEENKIEKETRRWNDEKNITETMRTKEDAIDYKYFVDPNIPKIKIEKEWLEEIRKQIPMLPNERKKLYINKYNLSDYDASVIVKDKDIADYFEACIKINIEPKIAANWVTTQILGYLNNNELEITELFLTPTMLKTIVDMISIGTISTKQAKEIFFKALNEKKKPEEFISSENTQLSDEAELNKIIKNILTQYPNQINEYKSGKDNLFDFFVGQVMKETKGKANPVLTKKILTKELEK